MIDAIMLIFKITLFVFFIYSVGKLVFELDEVNQMRLTHRVGILFCIIGMVFWVEKLMSHETLGNFPVFESKLSGLSNAIFGGEELILMPIIILIVIVRSGMAKSDLLSDGND
ncbi:TPA: hypothetical protein I7E55_001836 [Vibrio cholerae]|nr:hypothetical protein [Vibrio cholerae]